MHDRARRYLEEHGITLSALVRAKGRSKTTWSRFLNEGRSTTGDPRRDVEDVLRNRGVPVPPDLWSPPRRRAKRNSNDETTGGLDNMQAQALSQAAHKAWHLFMSPFDPEAMIDPATGEDRLDELHLPVGHQFALARLVQTLVKTGFTAISGEPGSGKTTLTQLALRRAADVREIVTVTPANIERRKLSAAHIAAEIIRQLADNPVPRIANQRDALAAEVLLHRYQQGQRVALIIDEAHELPEATIKDLKRYHELSHGFARLLGILLIGQSELMTRFAPERNHQLREVIIRCQLVPLQPMTGESAGYIARRFSYIGRDCRDVFEADALRAIEQRLAAHRQQYPVLIGNVATASMNIAARRGDAKVNEDAVEAVWQMPPEQLQEYGL